jgi:hypothetical protein
MWEPRRVTTLWAFTAYYRIALPFILFVHENDNGTEKTHRSVSQDSLYSGQDSNRVTPKQNSGTLLLHERLDFKKRDKRENVTSKGTRGK